MAPTPPGPTAGIPSATSIPDEDPNYKWKVLISVIFGIFMIILDSTVVNVAFQTLRREFGGTLADSQWVLSVYVLALGITTPMSGFLGDRFGTKRIYLFGLSLFVVGSLLCGFAPSLLLLIVARGIQGIGGGMAQPLGPAMLYRAWPLNKIGTALGYFGIVLTVAPALGPILGGFLVDANIWRVIFFLNIPIGIIGVFLGSRFLRNDKAPIKPKLDPVGLILAVIGFGSVLYAASIAETNGWTSGPTLTFFAMGIVALIAFAIVELFIVREPLLNLRLFKIPVFLIATLIGYVATVGLFGAEFLMPLYLQAMRGRSAIDTGLILLGVALASGITTQIAGRLYDRVGPRPIVIVGFLLLVINTWQLAQIQALTSIQWIIFLLSAAWAWVWCYNHLYHRVERYAALAADPRLQPSKQHALRGSSRGCGRAGHGACRLHLARGAQAARATASLVHDRDGAGSPLWCVRNPRCVSGRQPAAEHGSATGGRAAAGPRHPRPRVRGEHSRLREHLSSHVLLVSGCSGAVLLPARLAGQVARPHSRARARSGADSDGRPLRLIINL